MKTRPRTPLTVNEQLRERGERIDERLLLKGMRQFLEKYVELDDEGRESIRERYASQDNFPIFQVDTHSWSGGIKEVIKKGGYKIEILETVTKNNPRPWVVFEINGQKYYTISGKLFEAIKKGEFEESK